MKSLSTNQELDVAIAIAETLGIDADNDDNLWALIDLVNIEQLAKDFQQEIFKESV